MRVNQIASFAQMTNQVVARATKPAAVQDVSGVQKINQARLSDAAKGYTQATRIRDGVAATDKALGQAQALVKKAQDPALSAADRQQLQADFTKNLAAVDQGAKEQASAGADKTLANKSYDAKRIGSVAADRIGQRSSRQFASVAGLSQLDLTTATPDQLAQASKVLDTAKKDVSTQLTTANSQVDRVSGRLDKMNFVKAALEGNATSLSAKQQRDASAIANMLQQQSTQLAPGSLINTIV